MQLLRRPSVPKRLQIKYYKIRNLDYGLDIGQIDWNLYTDCGCQRDVVLGGASWQSEYDASENLLDNGAIGRSTFGSYSPNTQTANGKCSLRHLTNCFNSSTDRATKFRKGGILIVEMDSEIVLGATY